MILLELLMIFEICLLNQFDVPAYPHTRISAYPHIRVPAYPHTRISAYPHTRISAYPHTRISAYPHIRIPAYPRTRVFHQTNNLHCATKIEPPWLTVAQMIKACIVIGLQRCTVADYGSKLLYLVTISQFYAR